MRYTKEEFVEAVEKSENISEVLVKLGLKPKGGNYAVLRRKAKTFDVDISIFDKERSNQKVIRAAISEENIINATKTAISYQSVLTQLGLKPVGTNNRWIRDSIQKLNIDITHFLGQGHLRGGTHNYVPARSLEEILKNDTYYSSGKLRKRLVGEKIFENKCSRCGIVDWNNEPLTLHLDHINGIHTDNRIENLQILCPNCHSQTNTYCGKNKKRKADKEHIVMKQKQPYQPYMRICIDCSATISKRSIRCKKCTGKIQGPKYERIVWPQTSQLLTMVEEIGFVQAGKKLGVSDNAIRKRIKHHPND